MINASELRLGNNLEYNDSICTVLTISETSIRCLIDNDIEEDMFNVEDLSGIPLTKDLLSKLGFVLEAGEYGLYWGLGNFSIGDTTPYFIEFNGGGKRSSVRIKYLHHLQNIVFALTGEELPIK